MPFGQTPPNKLTNSLWAASASISLPSPRVTTAAAAAAATATTSTAITVAKEGALYVTLRILSFVAFGRVCR